MGSNSKMWLRVAVALLAVGAVAPAHADVAKGDATSAKRYFRLLSKKLGFSTPAGISGTTLDDVAAYLGYAGLTGQDMQNLPSNVLMSQDRLLDAGTSLSNRVVLTATLGEAPMKADDVLVSRFFAPKIMNIKVPEATRQTGWRKLVRLRARPGSAAEARHIEAGIILFNFFSSPGAKPFAPKDNSVNTQVMLLTAKASVPPPGGTDPAMIYWLDYDSLANGGRLSLALNATFDASELPDSSNGTQPYFVPDGCVACHGESNSRSLVNYLDTDHWVDRLDTDFPALKASGQPLLADAQTNDPNELSYQAAFEIIRRFNQEADDQVQTAQPTHDEALASRKWMILHASSAIHVDPIDRAIGPEPRWSAADPNDPKVLAALNQYCFRCHGTVRFSVFNKANVAARHALIVGSIDPKAKIGIRMPPDRPLDETLRAYLLQQLPRVEDQPQ